ncbi:MAG: helix-turn-helix transcriptional regulator [Chloroflexi bacterium]|nr:helix-turn-helix transcriptional regulator [Chloroflexota bacterium]
MDWREFGRLIRHLRFELAETEMRKITQEELDRRCGFPLGTVGRIERGDMRRLDQEHLVALADAFRLTQLERREFFLAANGVPTEKIYSYPGAPPPEEELNLLLQGIRDLPYPAFVTDVYMDFVYAHHSALALWGITDEILEEARAYRLVPNAIYYSFHPRFRFESMFVDPGEWFHLAVGNVQLFRRATLRYRTHRYWDYLMHRMQTDDPRLWSNFRIFWLQAEMRREWDGNTRRRYRIRHPKYGPLHYLATVSEESTAYGPLYVTIYVPLDHATHQAFLRLRPDSGPVWEPIAPWPERAKDRFIPANFQRPKRRRI